MEPILFKQDWEKYPTAVVDYQTKNTSFLKLVDLYAGMGVDNCEFPLALLQPELIGVDPHDPDVLTDENTMRRIAMEVKFNPWYYFREVVRVPPNSGNRPVPLQANRGNISLYWSYFNHVDFALLQPRQTGKSLSTDVLFIGVTDIWGEKTAVYLITKDNSLRIANVQRLKKLRNLLPEYIYYRMREDGDNSEMLFNSRLGNIYKTAVGRSDLVGADKLGRGLTVPNMHFDEVAYISLIGVSLPVALGAGSAARDEARENNQLFGSVYTTTAGSLNNRDGAFAHNFLTNGLTWSERFLDCKNNKELVKLVERHSANRQKEDKRANTKPLIYAAFNHRQLGKSDMWLFRKLKEVAASGDIADRDWMNIWTTGSEGSPLTLEDKQAVSQSIREPDYLEITGDGYVLNWFVPEDEIEGYMESRKTVLAVDPSEALGQDNDPTSFLVIDVVTHDVVCVGRYNETNITTLSKFIGKFLIKYKNVTFIPERKSTGITIINTLILMLPEAGEDPFRRIFSRIIDEQETMHREFDEIRRVPLSSRSISWYDQYTRYFGYNTSGSGRHARDNLYGASLKSFLRLGASRVYSSMVANELLGLTVRNGRIDHTRGHHDDLVIAMLLAHWFCTEVRNKDYYGIDPRKVFSQARRPKATTPEEVLSTERQEYFIAQFDSLMEDFSEVDDPATLARIEMKIRRLGSRIDLTEQQGVGIDAMIEQAREARERRMKLSRYKTRDMRLTTTRAPMESVRGHSGGMLSGGNGSIRF